MRSPQISRYKEKKTKQRKAVVFTFLFFFCIFLAKALFGESGILVNMQVQAEHRKLIEQQQALELENQKLRDEILALKTNPRKIEAVGRSAYGFSRPGEIVFIFPKDSGEPVQQLLPTEE